MDGSSRIWKTKNLLLTFKKYQWSAAIPCYLENFDRDDKISHNVQGTWISPTVEVDAAEYPVVNMVFNVPANSWNESYEIMQNVTTVTRMMVVPPGEPCMVEMSLNKILEDPHEYDAGKPVACIIQSFDVNWNIQMGLLNRENHFLPRVYTITIQYMIAKSSIPFEKAETGEIELSEGPRGPFRDSNEQSRYTPEATTRSVVDLSVRVYSEGYIDKDWFAVFGSKGKRKSEE